MKEKNVNIFEYDMIMMPFYANGHQSLFVVRWGTDKKLTSVFLLASESLENAPLIFRRSRHFFGFGATPKNRDFRGAAGAQVAMPRTSSSQPPRRSSLHGIIFPKDSPPGASSPLLLVDVASFWLLGAIGASLMRGVVAFLFPRMG